MKTRKILAALAASALALTMTGLTAFAAGQEDDAEEVTEVVEEEIIEEEIIEEDVEEEVVEEDFVEEDFVEEDFAEEETVEEEVVEEEVEEEIEVTVEDVPPVTGNASAAIAVIPVALAAAAIVAKKAK